MPQWRLKLPDQFPRLWHEKMAERAGWHILSITRSRSSAERDQVEWRLFQYSLRNYPYHPTAQHLSNDVTRRTKVEQSESGWLLTVTIRPSTKNIFAQAKILEN